MGASPWPETAKPGVTSLQDTYMVSCVWFWSLRNLQAVCVQDVTSLVCDVDVFDLGAWMRGKPDVAKRSVASMRRFKKRRTIE